LKEIITYDIIIYKNNSVKGVLKLPEFKIVIIDDDEIFVSTLKELLLDFQVDYFTDSKSGIKAIENSHYDLLILDYFIDDFVGEDVVQRIRDFNKEIHIMILTGYSNRVPPVETLKRLDVQDYCEKDHVDFNPIILRIESAVKSVKLNKNNRVPDIQISFSNRLKSLREAKGEMQIELANALGISRQALGTYESGRSEPTYAILRKISRHYKVSIDYLLDNKY